MSYLLGQVDDDLVNIGNVFILERTPPWKEGGRKYFSNITLETESNVS